MRKKWAGVLATAATGALLLSACGGGGSASSGGHEEVKLTFVTAWPEKVQNNDGFWIFRDRLKQKAPWVTIDYRGGPEVIPPSQMIEGVSSGAFDGAHIPGDYYSGQLPAVDLQRFTPFTPTQERENGIAKLYQDIHKPLGVHYVGHTHSGIPQVLLLKDRIDKPDLSGKTIRTSAATTCMVKSLGGTPVDMPGGEVYTALERGVVQGTAWASVGPTSWGFEKQTKYYLSPRFYDSIANTLINQDKWESLDKETQEAINATMAEVEPEIFKSYQEASAKETALWNKAGMKRIEFTGQDADKILSIAYKDCLNDVDWTRINQRSPEAAQLRQKFEAGYGSDLTKVVPGGVKIKGTDES